GTGAAGARILPIKNGHMERHARLQGAFSGLLARQRSYALQFRHDDAWADFRRYGAFLAAAKISVLATYLCMFPCPLWVSSRHLQCNRACPLYPPKADMRAAARDVCFGPEADSCTAANIRQGLFRGQFRVLVC